MLHHQLSGPLRDQEKTVEIAEAALPLNSSGQIDKSFLPPRLKKPRQARIKHDRFGERRDLGNVEAAIVAEGAFAAESAISLAHSRHARHAGNLLLLVLQANEGGPKRNAADEIARAVDRIDDPSEAGIARSIARFLAQKAISGKGAQKASSQQGLRLAIGQSDRA